MTKRTLSIVLVLGLIVALGLSGAGVSTKVHAEESQPRLISVTGEASMQVKPDMATVSFGVETNAPTAAEAQQTNSRAMDAVVRALLAVGIAREDIQTSNFSLYPVYEWRGEKPEQKQVLVGYRCNNTVVAKIRDIARIGEAIDRAVAAGATNIGGISFGLQDPEPLKTQLLAQAVIDARSKAETMAKAAGVTITGVYRISGGWASVEEGRGRLLAGVEGTFTPVEPGLVTIRASVQADFTF
ncbi:MAG: SIMPL domain-containing protein [Firmicutes bacterium]|nr:SIMPL domain-containing protein [Candidatus Fermentithermobacillaceae bacterium]